MIAGTWRTLLLGVLGAQLLLVTAVAATGLPAGAAGLSLSAASASRTGAAAPQTPAVAEESAEGSGDAIQQHQQSPSAHKDEKEEQEQQQQEEEQKLEHMDVVLPVADGSVLSQGCTFFLVRHGQSHPNIAGKIVSGMEDGVDPANGLTELGREQALTAGKELKEVLLGAGCSPANTIVLTSPFSRAKETAEAIQDCLGCELREERDLRERYFGDFDGRDDASSCYEKVWALDALSARHGELGVEPADQVAARAAEVVRRVRKEVSIRQRFYSGDDGQPFPPGPSAVVLVSHGDALQMLQCALAGRPVEQHRSLPHVENCGIRVLRPPPEAAAAATVVEAGDGGSGQGEGEGEGEEGGREEEQEDGGTAEGEEGLSGGGAAASAEAFRLMTGARVFRAPPAREGEEGDKRKDVEDDGEGDGDGNGQG